MIAAPDYILFAQHGWADDNQAMLTLARQLVRSQDSAHVVAPCLNYLQTWLRIDPLVAEVERQAIAAIDQFPDLPLRIVGHSMGGLIWLELLSRYPDRWPRIESLVLIASPVGGADLGRLIDPLGIGLGIAADLGVNRRPLAAMVVPQIPTLVIAGDVDQGSDGTIPLESTKILGAQFVVVPGVSHAQLRHHATTARLIRQFWGGQAVGPVLSSHPAVERLRRVPGITDGHPRDFPRAEVVATLADQSTLRVWHHPLGLLHLFVGSAAGECLYAGFVGWLHRRDAQQALAELRESSARSAL